MITLLISIVALILGYVFYSCLIQRVFAPDPLRTTPAYANNDGVDYVPMPTWKVLMIQFLNIAGTGPIFGAIMGAKFGPSCYLWIVLGCIFAGAVHDYLSGMLSLRHNGASLPDLVGKYLGTGTRGVMLVFSAVMLLLVGAVFIYSPAEVLGNMINPESKTDDIICIVVIILYYIIATLVPIDKIIGKIYPVFAIGLIFMALSLFICLLVKWPADIPEIWDGIANRTPSAGSIFPCLFITIACGAVSGFHATQSPLMARCLKNEKLGRPVFYGAMILEGVVALIWATVASYFFYGGGAAEFGSAANVAAPQLVAVVCKGWLGTAGAVLAILGVVAAPITSGDTALRSVRLTVAEAFKISQKGLGKRLAVSIPIFAVTLALLMFNIFNEDGFSIIWRYFGWANQTMAAFTLWMLTAFLVKERKGAWYLLTLLPAVLMTSVCLTFIATAKIGFNIPAAYTSIIGAATAVASLLIFFLLKARTRRNTI